MKYSSEIKNKIITLYKSGMKIRNIADLLNLHYETVRRYISKSNIPIFKGKVSAFISIKNDLKQLLIGSLLGDGSFCYYNKNKKNCYISIAHCMKQFEYLDYKKSILDNYGLGTPIKVSSHKDKRFKSAMYVECREKSRLHPIFTDIRDKYYDISGHKRVNRDFVKDIDALGLAIWYMDDGYVTKNSCIFSSCSFTIEEQRILADILLEKFDLHFNLGKHDNSMYLQARDFPKFVNIIKPHIIPSMQYKLIPYGKRVLNKSDELLESCDANQQPSTPLTKCEGSETNS